MSFCENNIYLANNNKIFIIALFEVKKSTFQSAIYSNRVVPKPPRLKHPHRPDGQHCAGGGSGGCVEGYCLYQERDSPDGVSSNINRTPIYEMPSTNKKTPLDLTSLAC